MFFIVLFCTIMAFEATNAVKLDTWNQYSTVFGDKVIYNVSILHNNTNINTNLTITRSTMMPKPLVTPWHSRSTTTPATFPYLRTPSPAATTPWALHYHWKPEID